MSLFSDLIANPVSEKRFLAILEPYDYSGAGVVVPLYFSTHGFVSSPSDSPANTYFAPRLEQSYSFSRHLFSDGKISGRTTPGEGVISIKNTDAALDYLKSSYAWGGRRMRVYCGGPGFAFSDYGLIFEGTAQGLSWTETELTVNLRSKEYLLDKELQTEILSGTGGVNGTADLAGKLLPRSYGFCRYVEPLYIGVVAGKHTFRVSDTNGIMHIGNVWDRGVQLTYSGGVPVAGEYTFVNADGTITLGGSFVGPIVANVYGRLVDLVTVTTNSSFPTAYPASRTFQVAAGLDYKVGDGMFAFISRSNWMVGRVTGYTGTNLTCNMTGGRNLTLASAPTTHPGWSIRRYGTPSMIYKALVGDIGGLTINAASFAAMMDYKTSPTNTALTRYREMGIYFHEGTNGLDALDAIAEGTLSYWGFNRAGEIVVGFLVPPSTGTPVLTLDAKNIIAGSLVREPTAEPAITRTVRYQKTWRVHTSDEVAASVFTAGNADIFLNEWRQLTYSGASTIWPLAEEMTIEYLYDNAGPDSAIIDDQTDRVLYFFGAPQKDYYKVKVKGAAFLLDLGQVVKLDVPPYSATGGKNFVIVDIDEEANGSNVDIELGIYG